MEKLKRTPGELIAEDLEHLGCQQRELADKLEQHPAWVSRLRRGKMRINANRARLLASITGRDPFEYMAAQAWVDLERPDVDVSALDTRFPKKQKGHK